MKRIFLMISIILGISILTGCNKGIEAENPYQKTIDSILKHKSIASKDIDKMKISIVEKTDEDNLDEEVELDTAKKRLPTGIHLTLKGSSFINGEEIPENYQDGDEIEFLNRIWDSKAIIMAGTGLQYINISRNVGYNKTPIEVESELNNLLRSVNIEYGKVLSQSSFNFDQLDTINYPMFTIYEAPEYYIMFTIENKPDEKFVKTSIAYFNKSLPHEFNGEYIDELHRLETALKYTANPLDLTYRMKSSDGTTHSIKTLYEKKTGEDMSHSWRWKKHPIVDIDPDEEIPEDEYHYLPDDWGDYE